jgi:ribose 1,5-bisphosphokinase PhnN
MDANPKSMRKKTMAQAARTNLRSNRTAKQFAIARRVVARRAVAVGSTKIQLVDPAMLAACVDAGGFAEHAAY